MTEEGSEQRVMKSSAAADQLGISKSRLNQLAPLYEQVCGELPRGGGHVRLWTPKAIERIRSARLAVGEGRAVNMEAALRGFETLENTQSSPVSTRILGETPDTQAPPRALEGLAGEVHALREAVEDQNKLLSMLLRVEAHHLKRLEADSPLPVATADTSEKASLESADGIVSSAENQKDGEDARKPSTGHRIFMRVFPIMLPIPPMLITVMSALMMDVLLFAASLMVTAVIILAIWYYYSSWNDPHYPKTGRRTDELAEAEAQENE